ncbi:MAG: AraC family transcriptional regulator [Rhodocyclaceae bacterium]|jgi:AraC-like DNA-binding protein
MNALASPLFSLRSYGAEGLAHAHDHVQLVLPLHGALEIESEGRGGRLEASRGIVIVPGARHSQSAVGANRFLIVDCDVAHLGEARIEHWSRQPFVALSEAARRLIEFIELRTDPAQAQAALTAHAWPLLLDTLVDGVASAGSRLGGLLRRIEYALDEHWPVARMAGLAGMSVSRTHALFQSELGATPQQWLAEARLRHARHLLAQSDLALAEIALRVGYSDQTALTRAMRRLTRMTPAAYRRQHR